MKNRADPLHLQELDELVAGMCLWSGEGYAMSKNVALIPPAFAVRWMDYEDLPEGVYADPYKTL